MTPEEMNELAQRVAANIERQTGTPLSPASGTITSGEDAKCFTCSGIFRCRPSFMVGIKASEE